MWPRWLTVNQNLLLLLFSLSVYTVFRGALISYELIQEHESQLQSLHRNLTHNSPSPPPPCPVDFLGVPEALVDINVTCRSLLYGNQSDVSKSSVYERVRTHMKSHKAKRITDDDYLKMTLNCKSFIQDRGYITRALTLEEEEFPLAFNILLHRGKCL